MRMAVAGTGYVGLSLAVLLAQQNDVTAVDVLPEKVDLINKGSSPIMDTEIEEFLRYRALSLTATVDAKEAYRSAEMIVVATPTNYDERLNHFDTSHVDEVIDLTESVNPDAVIVVKSTVPVGYTKTIIERWPNAKVLFSPEFLREGRALYDNLHPSRIVVGVPSESIHAEELYERAEQFARLLLDGAVDKNVPTMIVRATEAEAVKLFSNTYLALRVSYFNELDTYAEMRNLDASQIIEAVGLDPRIGSHYNNPSFGYGGYCLPKDTKQLLANYRDVPQNLIQAIVEANETRMSFVADEVVQRVVNLVHQGVSRPLVGIYRLTMKSGSDNFRSSSVQGVMAHIASRGIPMLVFEPTLSSSTFSGCEVTNDLFEFKQRSDVIVANRWSEDLENVAHKVYTRDLFRRD